MTPLLVVRSLRSTAAILALLVAAGCSTMNSAPRPMRAGDSVRALMPGSDDAANSLVALGIVHEWDSTVVVLTAGMRESTVPLNEGLRFQRFVGSRRNGAKGAGLGFVAGGLVGTLLVNTGSGSSDDWELVDSGALGFTLGGLGGAVVGGVIGHMIESEVWAPVWAPSPDGTAVGIRFRLPAGD